jgi:glycosyltransferase involved in cell wall biosynthesis
MVVKVYPIVDRSWIPGRLFEDFKKHSKRIKFVDSPYKADAIWIMSYYMTTKILQYPTFLKFFFRFLPEKSLSRNLRDKYIMLSFHHLVPWKIDTLRKKLQNLIRTTKNIHFFSPKNLSDFSCYFQQSNMFFLPYWIDEKQFFEIEQKDKIRKRFDLPVDKILIGSFQRDTEVDLVTPKYEKGPDLFCEVLSYLDTSKYAVVLTGPRRDYIQNRLTEMKVSTYTFGYVPSHQMNEFYNAIDLYLVSSRVEGGPQALIEAPLAGTAVFSTDVGIARDVCPDEMSNDSKILASKIQDAHLFEVATKQRKNCLEQYAVEKVVREYEEHFIKSI